MKSRQSDLLKLETVKTISTPRKINAVLLIKKKLVKYNMLKINAVLLNIKINQPKVVNMCGYKLATNWHNFREYT